MKFIHLLSAVIIIFIASMSEAKSFLEILKKLTDRGSIQEIPMITPQADKEFYVRAKRKKFFVAPVATGNMMGLSDSLCFLNSEAPGQPVLRNEQYPACVSESLSSSHSKPRILDMNRCLAQRYLGGACTIDGIPQKKGLINLTFIKNGFAYITNNAIEAKYIGEMMKTTEKNCEVSLDKTLTRSKSVVYSPNCSLVPVAQNCPLGADARNFSSDAKLCFKSISHAEIPSTSTGTQLKQ